MQHHSLGKTSSANKAAKRPSFFRNGSGSFFSPSIQSKLTINTPGDVYEQEADAMADRVVGAESDVQRKCAGCEEEEKLQLKENAIHPIQREEVENEPQVPLMPPLNLPSLNAIDYLDLQKPFLNRGVMMPGSYMDDATLEWQRQYGFYSRLGMGGALGNSFVGDTLRFLGVQPPMGDWNAWLSNTTTPMAVDSALSRDFPTFNEREERSGGLPAPTMFNLPGVHFKRQDGMQDKTEIDSNIEAAITGNAGKGNTLEPGVRLGMEKHFGHDFSDVKIHADHTAAQLNRQLNARAFTSGNNIFFNQGEYAPTSGGGQHLLAHELTHVVQQSGGSKTVQRDPLPWGTRVRNAGSESDAAAKDAAYIALITEALGTGTTVRSSTNNADSVDAAITAGNYAEWSSATKTVNFDANFNGKSGIVANQYGETIFKTDGGVKIYIVLGPNSVQAFGPAYTQMANAHEQAHANDFNSQGASPHAATEAEELTIYTQGFVTYFLSLTNVDAANCSYEFGESFDSLFTRYTASPEADRNTAFTNIQTFYNGSIKDNATNLLKFKIWLQTKMNSRPASDLLATRLNTDLSVGLTRGTNPITLMEGCEPG